MKKILFGLFATVLLTQSSFATDLKGLVVYGTGLHAPNVSVSLSRYDENTKQFLPTSQMALTDYSGVYSFNDVKAGDQFRLEIKGRYFYSAQNKPFVVQDEKALPDSRGFQELPWLLLP